VAKKSGLLGALLAEISEPDEKAPDKSEPALAKASPPGGNVGVIGAAAPAITPTVGFTPPTASAFQSQPAVQPLDEATVKLIQDSVYRPLAGRPSQYLAFVKVWEALGRPQNIEMALNALKAMDSNVNAASILTDIEGHINLLDQACQKADSDFTNAAQQQLGGKDAQIEALNDANQTAMSEIERHQREVAERITQITALQQERAATDTAIQQAKARTDAAEDAVRGQLTSMAQLFSNLR
jgi:hypothetical protein